MIKLGSHISFKAPNYLEGAARESISNGANTMMIYLGAPQNVKRVDVSNYKLEEYINNYSDKISQEDIVVHAPYIINPSSPEKNKFAIDFLIQEIKRMNYVGAKYLVLHPGAHTKFDRQDSINTLINSLRTVINKTENVVICIETMAGKGTEVGTNFKELKFVLDSIQNDRVQICLDTCHVWDAGYDIKKYDEFKAEINKFDLLKNIKVIHLNDSKNDLSSHKDRHANIDKGFIGLESLRKFVHDKDFDNIPIILETPWTDNGPIYDKEIEMLLK
ncbi:deoxyribonuclease IV [Mycoplasma sp. Mirounga ES2805-ORL]|uniref:deoxyribonuclease IV n=1 Tax=Mycoplasma sp. Mirounga ES2805-ORL TaxID=754514 RepID=UPI00197B3010|nr:deoxyribonuclease IV [Mycoplasma sp. Mirounga ES2805-ORL]QSF13575.1 deoxyribonuclease IV [Mycoplasma sp. Mirounga ES2805-ORL]